MTLFSEHRLIHAIRATKPTRQDKANTIATQNATHAAAINPGRPTPAPAYIPQTGTGDFASVEEAQVAQDAHYIQTGSNSQTIDANIHNLTQRLTHLQNVGDTAYSGDPVVKARLAAANAEEAYAIQQQLDAIQKKKAEQAKNAAMGAGQTVNPVTGQSYEGAAGQRLQTRMNRQTFIEEKRQEGKSDQEIRQMIETLPPEETGGASQDTPPEAPKVNPQTTPDTTPTGQPGQKTANDPNGTQAAPTSPNANILRNLAATVEDPVLRVILNAEADRADAEDLGDPMGQAEFMAGDDAMSIAKPYDAIDKILDRAYATAEKTYASQKAFLKGQFDRTDKLLADKEENIQNQLAFAKDKAVRVQADANKKNLDSQTIMLALQGGFGSSDGNQEILEARLKGEQAIIDLTKEFGFKKADVSLQFTEMTNQAFDAYQQAWLSAADNFEARVSDLDLQGISNQQAKSSALGGAYKDYVAEIKEARKQHATIISNATQMVYEAINTQRDDKRAEEKNGWERMEWAAKTYGSDTPQAIIDSIAKQLPGVDIKGALGSMTLAEMKQRKIGSGGGSSIGISFTPTQKQANGSPVTFEQFVSQKETEALNSGAMSFDTSKAAMARYREEYDTKLKTHQQLDPTQIVQFMNDRIKNITAKNVRENIQRTVKSYLDAGEYDLAFNYVDGLGKDAPASLQQSFSKAATAKQNVNRLAGLIEDLGAMGPGIGQFRTANPFDDRVVEFNNLVRQTVPGLARGIFGEVGVLTDSDIKTYTATMANPNLTQDQARTATKNLLKTINLSIENQINVARGSGINTRDVKPLFNAITDYEFGSPQSQTADEAFAQSILLRK